VSKTFVSENKPQVRKKEIRTRKDKRVSNPKNWNDFYEDDVDDSVDNNSK